MSRPHHYIFAHVALRHHFLEDPKEFTLAITQKGPGLIASLWEFVGRKLLEDDPDAEVVSDEGLMCNLRQLRSNHFAVVVTLPPPQEMPEAYFVAMVVRPGQKKLGGLLGETPFVSRYITLEYGVAFDDNGGLEAHRTVLGEWTGEQHLNYGTGPEPQLESFLTRVEELIS